MKQLLFPILMLVSAALHAAPWVVYGQVKIPQGGAIENPSPNTAGVSGEIAAMPYTVPAGKTLVIEAYGVEAYRQAEGGVVMVPWLGSPPATNAKCLHSVYAGDSSNETLGFRPRLPPGTILNVKFMSAAIPGSMVHGWYIRGRLVADE